MIHSYANQRLIRKLALFMTLAGVVLAIAWWHSSQPLAEENQAATITNSIEVKEVSEPPTTFNKEQYSTNDPTSLWVVVNKGRVLPSNYVPADLTVPKVTLGRDSASDNMHLRAEAAWNLEKLIAAAASDSFRLMLVSGYRSHSTQASIYGRSVSSNGQSITDATIAKPGHSEHQTGLAVDLGATTGNCQLEKCFGDMSEGKWLVTNAHRYGFIIRYQKDKQNMTGYDYEPWHLRYIGPELAEEINKSSQTLEQFFGLPTYVDYPAQPHLLKDI